MSWLTETLIDDERNLTYEFRAGFDYSQKFNELKRSHQDDYAKVCSGEPCLDVFLAVLRCSLSTINGKEILEHEIDNTVKTIIDRFGAQACTYVCHKIMFESYVGEVEAKKSQSREQWQEILESTNPFQSGTFIKAGSLWIATALISGSLGCVITSELLKLT